MAIHLGRVLPRASSNQPGRRCGNAFRPAAEATKLCRPYSVLLPAGFALPALLPALRCALTAPFHPYPRERGRFAFCGTFPGVAPAGRYPAPCFRGARTFLHPKSTRPCGPQSAFRAAAIRPTSHLSKGHRPRHVKMASEKMHGLYGKGTFRRVFAITAGVNHKQRQLGVPWHTEKR